MTKRKRPKVWLYLGNGKKAEHLAELDHADETEWQGNPLTKRGDLVLMYRTTPYRDIACVFKAMSDTRRTAKKTRDWPWKSEVKLGDGYRLSRVISLRELKEERRLRGWKFLKFPRGATLRRSDLQEQNVWSVLRGMLEDQSPGVRRHFGNRWWGKGAAPEVFLSYVHEDRRKANRIYDALAKSGLEVWYDRDKLEPSDEWNADIERAIKSSKAFVVCITSNWLKSDGYARRKELKEAIRIAKRRKNFIFPVLLDDCKVPASVSRYHHVPVYGRGRARNLQRLVGRIRKRRVR